MHVNLKSVQDPPTEKNKNFRMPESNERTHPNGPEDFFLPADKMPPCQDVAPLQLDGHQQPYRDCSKPDLEKVKTEPLIPRPPG